MFVYRMHVQVCMTMPALLNQLDRLVLQEPRKPELLYSESANQLVFIHGGKGHLQRHVYGIIITALYYRVSAVEGGG